MLTLSTSETIPTLAEVSTWIFNTIAHSLHVEYYLEKLRIRPDDPDRPHDLVGRGNKLSWEAIRGLALQYRPDGLRNHRAEIIAAREFHRQQYHHQVWLKDYDQACAEDVYLGAVDAVCSMLEVRPYQGGRHTFEKIREKSGENPPLKAAWLNLAVAKVRELSPLNLEGITQLSSLPWNMIKPETAEAIRTRAQEAIGYLQTNQGYNFDLSRL